MWQQLENWVKSKACIPLKLTLPEILLGYLKSDHFIPVNTKYTFSNSRSGQILSISELKIKEKTIYEEQYFLAKLDLRKITLKKVFFTYNTTLLWGDMGACYPFSCFNV